MVTCINRERFAALAMWSRRTGPSAVLAGLLVAIGEVATIRVPSF